MTENSGREFKRDEVTRETEDSKIPEYGFEEGLSRLVDLVVEKLKDKDLVRVGFVSLNSNDVNIGKTYLCGKLSERLQLAGYEVVSTGTDSFEILAKEELKRKMELRGTTKGVYITQSVASISSPEHGQSAILNKHLRSSYDVLVGLCRSDRKITQFLGNDLVIINEGVVDKSN